MPGILLPIGVALVALSVLTDPYTFHLSGSDAFVPAPLWQSGLALINIGLLIIGAVLLLREMRRVAFFVLAVEFACAATLNAVLIHRHGFDRFVWGFGAERHVLEVAAAFGLRVLVLIALSPSLRRREAGLPN
jgi:hypothetical protein